MKYKKTILLLATFSVLLFIAPSSKQKIKELKQELNATKETDVFKRYTLYKQLIEYKDQRADYNALYEEYERLYAYRNSCIASLPNLKIDSDVSSVWYTKQKLLISFNNLKYVCSIENNTTSLKIFKENFK